MTKDQLKKFIVELDQENKKLKEKIKRLEFDVDAWHQLKLLLEWEIERLWGENEKLKERIDELEKCNLNLQERLDRKEEVNKKMREEIKDHQLYEEKLEHRIIEFEELLHWE